MRTIITGVRDGQSRLLEEINCDAQGDSLATLRLFELQLDALKPRPPGKGGTVNVGMSDRMMRMMRVRFPPNQLRPMHHTDTIDCHTIVSGAVDLILDDGPHRLVAGDSAIVIGNDHSWQTHNEGCVLSMILISTPAP